MNKLGTSLVAATIMFSGMHAVADDMPKDHMNKEQMMKECMGRMAAKNDGSTKDQMKTMCEAEMQKGKDMGKEHMTPPSQ